MIVRMQWLVIFQSSIFPRAFAPHLAFCLSRTYAFSLAWEPGSGWICDVLRLGRTREALAENLAAIQPLAGGSASRASRMCYCTWPPTPELKTMRSWPL